MIINKPYLKVFVDMIEDWKGGAKVTENEEEYTEYVKVVDI